MKVHLFAANGSIKTTDEFPYSADRFKQIRPGRMATADEARALSVPTGYQVWRTESRDMWAFDPR